jgi:hypothetical protein
MNDEITNPMPETPAEPTTPAEPMPEPMPENPAEPQQA